jgi:large conductance mechanosensitive channel
MKKFLSEFRKFALRSNVMDLAVAVVIGNAINVLVKSVVSGIFDPFISIVTGKAAINSFGSMLSTSCASLLQAIINFLTITLCVFIMLKAINKLHSLTLKKLDNEPEEKDSEPPTTDQLLIEIRDLLKAQALSAGQSTVPENDTLNFPDGLDKEH